MVNVINHGLVMPCMRAILLPKSNMKQGFSEHEYS